MEVVLLQDVGKVGLRGEVVSVARGYMRNYLQPRRLAEPASAAVVDELRRRDAERARHEARTHEQAKTIAETLTKTVLRFEVKAGPQGVLFGSITPTDIADELWRVRKIRVDRRKIELADPIKRIGRYTIPIEVFQDVTVEVKTLVVPEGGDLDAEWPEEDAGAGESAQSDGTEAVATARGGHGHGRGDRNRGAGRRLVGRPEPARVRPLAGLLSPLALGRQPAGGGRLRADRAPARRARDARHCP